VGTVGTVQKLYQWFSERARFFRNGVNPGPSPTIRTEVTVERSRATVVLGDLTTAGIDTCPLCGQPLTPVQAQPSGLQLTAGREITQLQTNNSNPIVGEEKKQS